ncbi:MAG TPA: hypothetical protein DCY51_07140 [Bacteroidetes bacterium]|nr:hypothetical protein [Bacteroidota bacterium]|tara:strand:+ start:82 stop:300 length:219 start_codon:yes stop_codon:yes gene_type:complete
MIDKQTAGSQLHNIFWTAEGDVVIEIAERALILPRVEAEALFVDLGFVLKDMAHASDILQDEKEILAELADV